MTRSLPQHLLVLANASLLVASQLLLKTGLKQGGAISLTSFAHLRGFLHQILTTPALLGGICLGGASTLLWIVVLSRFELSYAMPLLNGVYYLLILLASVLVLGEMVTPVRWVGAALMVLGIALISGTK